MIITEKHTKISGHLNLYRDTESGAVISTAGNKRKQKEKQRQKERDMEERMHTLCREVEDIRRQFKEFCDISRK